MSKPYIEFRTNRSDGNSIKSDIQSIIPLRRLQKLRYLFTQNPLVEHIRSVLTKSIWSGGVNLYKVSKEGCQFTQDEKKERWTPPPDIQHTLETKWDSFKVDVFDSLLMYGWVCVHFQQVKDETTEETTTVPHVVPIELYRMLVSTTLERGTSLHALHVREQCELPDTVVFHRFSYDPTPQGMMTSLVAKASAELSYLSDHASTAMVVRQLRCRPTVVIEKGVGTKNEGSGNSEAQRRALLDGIHTDTIGYETADHPNATNVLSGHVAVPVGVNLEEDLSLGEVRFNRAREEAALRRGDVNEAARLSAATQGGEGVRRMGACTGIALKSGEQAKFAPTLGESNDFETTRRSLLGSIGGVFGVPLSVLAGGGGGSGSQNSNTGAEHTKTIHSMYRLGVQEWRKRMSSILTDCFTECYFDYLVASGGTSDEKPVNLYQEKKHRTVHVDFAPATFVGNEPLRQIYEWGVIDFKTFAQFCLSNLGLPANARMAAPPKENPLGIGLSDPNAEYVLKEKELELKEKELEFKEKEAKAAAKREEAAATAKATQQNTGNKTKATKRKASASGAGTAKKAKGK